jgi:hypothetical protein
MALDQKKVRLYQLGYKQSTAEGLTPEEEEELRRLRQEQEVKKKILSKTNFPQDVGND